MFANYYFTAIYNIGMVNIYLNIYPVLTSNLYLTSISASLIQSVSQKNFTNMLVHFPVQKRSLECE